MAILGVAMIMAGLISAYLGFQDVSFGDLARKVFSG